MGQDKLQSEHQYTINAAYLIDIVVAAVSTHPSFSDLTIDTELLLGIAGLYDKRLVDCHYNAKTIA